MSKHTNEAQSSDETQDRIAAVATIDADVRRASDEHTTRHLTRARFLSDRNLKHDVQRLTRAKFFSDVNLKHDVRPLG